MTADEYRYDALGRRVLVRTRRNCREGMNEFPAPCSLGTLRRTVWDGAEEPYEIQMFGGWHERPLEAGAENDTATVFLAAQWSQQALWDPNPRFGRAAYTHGPGLDQPLALTRINFTDIDLVDTARVDWPPLTIVPHWNWRGNADFGTMADGGWKTCLNPSSTRCVSVAWSGKQLAFVQPQPDLGRWWGSLITEKEDGTGTLYRRNRYLDPATGRFTQEDPIGLAGGLNLYGFANGDPVTFSDPFGLIAGPPCGGIKRAIKNLLQDLRQHIDDWQSKPFDKLRSDGTPRDHIGHIKRQQSELRRNIDRYRRNCRDKDDDFNNFDGDLRAIEADELAYNPGEQPKLIEVNPVSVEPRPDPVPGIVAVIVAIIARIVLRGAPVPVVVP